MGNCERHGEGRRAGGRRGRVSLRWAAHICVVTKRTSRIHTPFFHDAESPRQPFYHGAMVFSCRRPHAAAAAAVAVEALRRELKMAEEFLTGD